MWSNLLLGEAEVEYGMSETGLVMMDTTVLGIYQTSRNSDRDWSFMQMLHLY